MARIQPIRGYDIVVQLGDGASPEVFSATATINTSRGITFTQNTESNELIDVADQSKPATTVRTVTSTDTKIDGAGMVHAPDMATWIEWSLSGEARNIRIYLGADECYQGAFLPTSIQYQGERASCAEFSVTLEQADEVTKVAN